MKFVFLRIHYRGYNFALTYRLSELSRGKNAKYFRCRPINWLVHVVATESKYLLPFHVWSKLFSCKPVGLFCWSS